MTTRLREPRPARTRRGSTAPPPLDESPFLRPKSRVQQRAARRERLGRLTLTLQVAGVATLAALGLWLGYARTMASDGLKVSSIVVRGNQHLSEGEVRELLGIAVGENILALDIERLKDGLTASPWVARATVRRSLPSTIEVEIREREPLALAELDRLYLMDGSGALIEIYGPRSASFDLPIVRGLRDLDTEARADRAGRAGALLDDLGELAAEVSEVSVEESGDLRVVLRGPGEVLRLGLPPYRERLALFLRLRRELTARCPRAEYFDLRFRSRIVAMEPSAGGGEDAEQAQGDEARVARQASREVIRW